MSLLWGRWIWAGLVLSAVGIVALALAYNGAPFNVDQAVMDWVFANRSDALTPHVHVISELFGPELVTMWTIVIAVVLACRDRTAYRAVTVLAAVVSAGVVTETLKLIVSRPRPPMAYHLATEEITHSFPSGHATGTSALAFTTAIVATVGARREVRRLAIVMAVLITAMVAGTRLYLGVHWVTDVAAGAAIGVVAALLVPDVINAGLNLLQRQVPGRLPAWVD
ncbi:phosphatase PAP2 family protein [Aldersonia kunmingensis]|uniref:phosphatase PAP2 family protein n=1 Tax=Aldersonia kunmingensis TaxID=408066 RepID=UPI0008360ABE|nr:phosphatase PAP2 family protein [Aldersonia kunmingensis]